MPPLRYLHAMVLVLLVALFSNRYSLVVATAAAASLFGLFIKRGSPQVFHSPLGEGGLEFGYILFDVVLSFGMAVGLGSAIYFGRKQLMKWMRRLTG